MIHLDVLSIMVLMLAVFLLYLMKSTGLSQLKPPDERDHCVDLLTEMHGC